MELKEGHTIAQTYEIRIHLKPAERSEEENQKSFAEPSSDVVFTTRRQVIFC